MRQNRTDKHVKTSTKKAQKQVDKQSPEFETMSQKQNRHGKGRQQNGSDSSASVATGSNH